MHVKILNLFSKIDCSSKIFEAVTKSYWAKDRDVALGHPKTYFFLNDTVKKIDK